jgi:hypothetical protein
MIYIGWATHALQGVKQTGQGREPGQCCKNAYIRPQGAILLSEGEIVSNRKSARFGEA